MLGDGLISFGGQNAMDKQYMCLLIADIRSNFCLEINVRLTGIFTGISFFFYFCAPHDSAKITSFK